MNFLSNYIKQDDFEHMGQYFRKESVNVITATSKVIHTGIESKNYIYDNLSAALNYLSDENENIFIRISVFHYLFGYIYPFYDGNGRMARLITANILYHEIEVASLALSETIAKHQSTYYQMFDETNSNFNVGDVTSFVYNFLNFISESMTTTLFHLESNTKRVETFNSFISALQLHNTESCLLSIIYIHIY